MYSSLLLKETKNVMTSGFYNYRQVSVSITMEEDSDNCYN